MFKKSIVLKRFFVHFMRLPVAFISILNRFASATKLTFFKGRGFHFHAGSVVFTATFLATQPNLLATTYFVATSGTDTNTGTSKNQPWRTIQKAAAKVAGGDVVIVQAGNYQENVRVNCTNNVSQSQRIVFRGEGLPTVSGFYIESDYVTVDGFQMSSNSVPQWDAAVRIKFNADHVWLLNNRIHHFENRYGVLTENGGVNPESSSQNCVISNNILEYVGYINLNLNGANHLIISNTFANSFGEGDALRVWGAHHRIVSNLMTNMGGGAPSGGGHPDLIQTFGDYAWASYDIVFEKNFCIDGPVQFCQLEQKLSPDIRDWTFRNNVFVRIGQAANCSLPGIWWVNNIFYRCTTNLGHVIVFSDGSNGKGASIRSGAKNNIFLECGSDPSNPTFGWYIYLTNLVDLDCNYNYVGGPNFTSKRADAGPRLWRFFESHGINGGNPWFSSIPASDFRLRTISPLIDKGVQLPTFNDDILGITRPVGIAWDIGPFESPDARPRPPQNLRVQ